MIPKHIIIFSLLILACSCNDKRDFQKLIYRPHLNYATPFCFETIDNLVTNEDIKSISQIIGSDTLYNFLKFNRKGYLCAIKHGYNDSTVFYYDKYEKLSKIVSKGKFYSIHEADSFIVSYKKDIPNLLCAYNSNELVGYINIFEDKNTILFIANRKDSKIPIQTDLYNYKSDTIVYEIHKVMYESFWDVKNQYSEKTISNKLINETGESISINFSKDSILEYSSVTQHNRVIKQKMITHNRYTQEIEVTYSLDSTTHIKKFIYEIY